MSSYSIATVPELIKEIWQEDVADATYEESPAWAMVPKSTNWNERYLDITIKYGGFAGRSSNFGVAKSRKSASKNKQMRIETSDQFALWSIDHKLMTLTRNNRQGLAKEVHSSTESALKKLGRAMGWMIYGDGSGYLGEILSISGATITFTTATKDACRKLDNGDFVEFSTSTGVPGGGGAVEAGVLEVLSVDEQAGTVTFTENVTTGIPSAVTTMKVFHEGDFAAAVYGFLSYVPRYTPGTNSVPSTIWGMDRTVNPRALAGIRSGGSGLLIVEAIKKHLTNMHKAKAHPSHMFMHPDVFNDLDLSLGTNRRYADEKIGTVGFTGIEFVSHGGKPIKCFSDGDCQPRLVHTPKLDAWDFKSADQFPQWLSMDGKKSFMTEENSNSAEGRVGGYGQLYTDAPFESGILDLDATVV